MGGKAFKTSLDYTVTLVLLLQLCIAVNNPLIITFSGAPHSAEENPFYQIIHAIQFPETVINLFPIDQGACLHS